MIQSKLVLKGFVWIYLFLTSPFVIILIAYRYKVIGVLFFFYVIIYIVLTIYKENKKFAGVHRWIGRQAQIKQIKIVKYACLSMYRKWNTKNNSYKVDVVYEYKVNDRIVTSNQYALAYKGDGDCNFLYTLDEATKIVQRMKKEKTITVYVNPKNPEESVIVKGKSEYYGISYSVLIMYVIALTYFLYKVYFDQSGIGL